MKLSSTPACGHEYADRVPLERDATVRVLNEELLEPAAAAVAVYNHSCTMTMIHSSGLASAVGGN